MTCDTSALDAAIESRGGAAAVVQGALESGPADVSNDPLALLMKWTVTKEQVDEMEQTELRFRNLIALSHLAGWIGPAGSCKTSVGKFAAGELSSDGFRVLFFQEDASAGDLPALFQHSQDHGYTLLNSTLAGSSTDDQIKTLGRMAKSGQSLTGVVMFFDTLKKFADLMSKGGTRSFFKLMRSLTQLGATIILLGHTNKHRGIDGKLMFEGVGDVRNDVDELIYLDATAKDPQGLVTVTMTPDKTRAAIEPATFEVDTTNMQVRRLDRVVNVVAVAARERQLAEDQPLIDAVLLELRSGAKKHTELIEGVVQATGQTKTAVRKVLDRYVSDDPNDLDAMWLETRMRLNNERRIAAHPRLQ